MSESCRAISPPQVKIFKLIHNLIDIDVLSDSGRHPQPQNLFYLTFLRQDFFIFFFFLDVK